MAQLIVIENCFNWKKFTDHETNSTQIWFLKKRLQNKIILIVFRIYALCICLKKMHTSPEIKFMQRWKEKKTNKTTTMQCSKMFDFHRTCLTQNLICTSHRPQLIMNNNNKMFKTLEKKEDGCISRINCAYQTNELFVIKGRVWNE